MCKLLKVSRSGYYAFLNRPKSKLTIENEVLSEYIKLIFTQHHSRYGCRRIKNVLFTSYNLIVSRKRITRLMRIMGLYAKGTTYKHKYKKNKNNLATSNLVDQVFTSERKNAIWFGDITYITTAEGNLYLSIFIDLFTRKIVGYSIKDHMRTSLVIDTINMAISNENPEPGLIVHTDQGSQYLSHDFLSLLNNNRFIPSNSNKGNPYDNAVVESFFKTFKREVLPKRYYKTKSEAILEVINYVEVYYNKKRCHSSLGYMTPNEFELANS